MSPKYDPSTELRWLHMLIAPVEHDTSLGNHLRANIEALSCATTEDERFLIGKFASACVDDAVVGFCFDILHVDVGSPFLVAKRFGRSVHSYLGPALSWYDRSDREDLWRVYAQWHIKFAALKNEAQRQDVTSHMDAIIRRDAPSLLFKLTSIAERVGGDYFRPREVVLNKYFDLLRLPIPGWMPVKARKVQAVQFDT